MNLNCAILHADAAVAGQIEEYIGKVPFLTLRGKFGDPLEALKGYYEEKVEIYFVGIYPVEEGGITGMDFCRLLSSPTRVVFIAGTECHAAECFRLDALDYLTGEANFSTFFQAVSKAARWFALQEPGASATGQCRAFPERQEPQRVVYVRAESCIMRLELEQINYIEGLGDYVKVFCKGVTKPILSLCSMKYMEEKLPSDEFIRVHRSFIVRKDCINAISRSSVMIEKKDVPIGDAYRERVKHYVSRLAVL
ncbi:LytTR family DNA-binding domain-containing protein [Bacteroides helcogenes]|uniref:Response regulator receiver protein n=1 Tax=Bacteroides helcogenes (strain ATCC 35417 / DSM 20613 / JCM 6297 / CCUG 15421 / P 36-108) TaxID=693979 RepID=E6SNF4_BACT6|nr:LytTR family DNA-binding domain-containing protein [Bacteroides helcogenes]ADV42747.1 response regulator receiver protein [Bacteroides helcogenes P 36-108]MDY5239579.1 LytTR family transcriptional regulator DNA-binding domain-containing protein [Bacteroides helcogenes]